LTKHLCPRAAVAQFRRCSAGIHGCDSPLPVEGSPTHLGGRRHGVQLRGTCGVAEPLTEDLMIKTATPRARTVDEPRVNRESWRKLLLAAAGFAVVAFLVTEVMHYLLVPDFGPYRERIM